MIWPLYISRKVVSRRDIRSTSSRVLEIVWDPETYCKLQPFVSKVEKDPASDTRYKVTERLKALWGLITYDNTFTADWKPVTKSHDIGEGMGADFVVNLGPNLKFLMPKMTDKIRVKEIELGRSEFIEVVELTALFFLMPFIYRTVVRAHEVMLVRLAAMVEANEDDTVS